MSPLAVLQGLLLQVFDKNIGELALYKAIVSSQRASAAGRSTSEVEDALWAALDIALSNSGKLMVVVDGMDQFGEVESHKFLEHLERFVRDTSLSKQLLYRKFSLQYCR